VAKSFRSFKSVDQIKTLELRILGFGIEARTGFMDIGEVAMTQDLCLGMFPFEPLEQCKERSLLFDGPGIGRFALLIQPSFVAYTQGTTVIALGMSTDKLLVACLGDGAVACDVVVVAREPEAVGVVADQLHHAIAPVVTGGGAVHYD